MTPEFTDDDIGKTVINAEGEEVGLIADVEHGTAHVEPDPGITDTIKAKLGWGGTDEDAYPLQEQAVAEVTDDEVHLQRDLESSSTSGAAGAGATGGTDTTREAGTTDTGRDTRTDDDDLIGDDDDDDLIGDDDDELLGDDDDDDLIGDDDDGLVGDDDDDDLIGDDDDELLGDDDDDDLIGDDDDTRGTRDTR
jgi:hypothetical protein